MQKIMMWTSKFNCILHPFVMKQKLILLIASLLSCHFLVVYNEDIPCVPRYFDADSFVCVCNATYCDTIEQPKIPSNNNVLIYTTSKLKYRFDAKLVSFQDKLKCQDIFCFEQNEITIDATSRRQTIKGFGGSFTDSAGINIKKLSKEAQNKLMESYFSAKGLEYNLCRVPIGGCDFSPRPYTYDDNSIGDLEFKNFSLQPEDYNYKIPFIKEASKLSPYKINLVATAWSPPAWMKTSDNIVGGVLNGIVGGIYYQAWAKYHIKFFEEYEKNGVSFWAVTTGNEPALCFLPFFNSNCLGFTPYELRVFVNQNLSPELRASKYRDIKLLIFDLNRETIIIYVTEIMSDTHAEEYVDGISLHWYNDEVVPAEIQDIVHGLYSDKFLLTTEASFIPSIYPGPPVFLGSWSRADTYAFDIIQNLQHWNSGWIDWNLVLDLQGGPSWLNNSVDAPVIVNEAVNEFYKQPIYYVMGHFSKFVPPGSVVINSKHNLNLESFKMSSVAFITPNSSMVLVVLNSNEVDVRVNIKDGDRRTLQTTIPGSSLQTYVWKKE